jgi:nicotinamide riboside transporter PnuC
LNFSAGPLVGAPMTDILSWIATIATIGGALLTASNLGARITGGGFVVFLFGSLAWIGVSLLTNQPALLWTNLVLTFLNLFGIWRWLGRQAAVEQGGKAAAEASESTPGEALFPVSLLLKAKAVAAGEECGTCVDAMAGEQSGRLAYVVVSQGGMAGVGERLRRVRWSEARVEQDRLVLRMGREQFCGLPEVTRDEWPAR